MQGLQLKDKAGAIIGQPGASAFAPPFPEYVEDVVLTAATVARIPIPTGARYVVFSFDGDFRAKVGVSNTPYALPSVTSTTGTGAELNPAARQIPPFIADGSTVPTHIVLIAAAAQKGSLSFYG